MIGFFFVAAAIVVGGLSYKAARDAQKAAKKAAEAMAGALVNKESNIEAIPVIYGERRVGGTRVFVHTEGGKKNEYLYIAMVLGEGEVESISDIEIDDYDLIGGRYGFVTTTDTTEKTTYQSSDGLITIEAFKGLNTQASSTVLSETSKWGSNHRLNGVAYLAMRFKWDEDKFSGMPEITAVVRGRKVFDPRTSTTAYSNNPALCIRDYLTNNRYGKGLPESAINDVLFSQAASDIESFVVTPYSGGSNIQLFECNAVLDTDDELFRNVERMLLGCRGFLPYSNGQYGLVIDQSATATMTLDSSKIIGGISIQGEEKKEKFNRVLIKFPNPSTDWQPDQAVWPDAGSTEETTFLAEDGGTLLVDEVDMETITNIYSARDFARILCLRSRSGLRCGLKATSEAINLVVGDVVNVTHPTPGWTNKPFQLEELTLNYDGTVDLKLVEYDPNIYAYDSAPQEATYTDTDLPDPLTAEAATGLLLSPGSEILDDGSVNAYVDISWTASDDQFVNRYEVLVIAAGLQSFQQETSDTSIRVGGLTVGVTYTVQVVAVNSNNIRSGAISDTFVAVGDSTPPGVPTSIAVQGNLKSIDIFWTNPSDKDLSYVEIKESTNNVEANAVSIGRSAGTEYIVSFPNGIFTRYYWLRSVDTSGNASVWVYAGTSTTLLLGAGDFDDGIIDFDYFNTTLQNRVIGIEDDIVAEAALRTQEIQAASQVLQDQINDLIAVEAYDNATTYAIDDQVTYNGKLYRAIAATTGNLPTDTNYWQLLGDFTSLGDAVGQNTADIIELNTVSASSTSTTASTLFALKSDVEDATTGLAATRATLLNNYYTETQTDSAIATAITGLATVTYVDTELGSYTTTADLVANYYTATQTDSAISSATTGLASVTYVNTQLGNYTTTADLTTNYYTKTQADSAIATEITTLEASLNSRVLSLPLDQWKNLGGQSIVSISDGIAGPTALRLTGPGGFPNQGTYIQIDPEKTYRVKFWARPSADNANGKLYFSLRQFLPDGTPGPLNGGRSPYKPAGFLRSTHISIYGDTWGEYVYDWTSSDWQTGVTQVLPEFLDNYNNETTGHWDIQGFEIIDATNVAAVEQTTVALVSADSALAADITSLTSTVNNNTSAISSEASTRASADSALAADITTVQADITNLQNYVESANYVFDAADSSIFVQGANITSIVDQGDYVEITEGTGTRETSGTTNGAWLTIPADFAIPLAGRRARITVQARAGTQSTFAVAYSTAHVGNSGVLAATAGADWRLFDFFYDVPATSNSTVDYIGIFADNNNGSIEIRKIIVSAETQGVLNVEASVTSETSARVSADSALAADITSLTSTVNSNTAAISSEASTRASADSALSTSITNLTTTVSGNTTTIQQQATTIDGISAQYSVAIDNNGHISGYALISADIGQGETPTSQFIVNADAFAIGGTGSASDSYPFVVYPAGATVDGVAIPAGTYIDSARINYLSADKIEAGVLDLGNQPGMAVRQGKTSYTISGTGFWLGNDNGTPKFILGTSTQYIAFNGSAGTIDASGITARSITIRNASNQIMLDSNGIDGTYIEDATIQTAAIADLAVDTIKIAGNAVTFPESAYTQAAITKSSGVTSEQVIQTVTVTSTGAPTEIFGSFTIDSTYNLSANHTIRIRKGDDILAQTNIVVGSADEYPFAAAVTDSSTTTGSRTYTITAQGFGSWSITNRYIRTLELKR